jgi:hypothetical protein
LEGESVVVTIAETGVIDMTLFLLTSPRQPQWR